MMAQKPESFRMPPGGATVIKTEEKAVNGCAKNVDNSFSHPGASRTGRLKDWEAEPAPTITATGKGGIQTRILPHRNCIKARRTQKAQTRATDPGRSTYSGDQGTTSLNGLAHRETKTGMLGRDRVTSKSAMDVTL